MRRPLFRLSFALLVAGALTGVAIQMVVLAQTTIGATSVCFQSDADQQQTNLRCVERQIPQNSDMKADLQGVLTALVAGPSSQEQADGIWSALPDGSELTKLTLLDGRLTLFITLAEATDLNTLTPWQSEQIVRQVGETVRPYRQAILTEIEDGPERRLITHVLVRTPDGEFRDLAEYLHRQPLVRKDDGSKGAQQPGLSGASISATKGFLADKAVYMSAGHGWYWSANPVTPTESVWLTQRPVWQDLIEDFNNAEVVNQYLLPYLTNAGADVWSVRERDMNHVEVTATVESAGYGESGVWIENTDPITVSTLVFPRRTANTSATPTAAASWTVTPAITARQTLYVWYEPGPDRAPDAHYVIQHAGGERDVRVDQQVHGLTWRFLGEFPFYADQPVTVTLQNDSATTDGTVSAGAIRIGGGMGSESGGWITSSQGSSQKPRYEEASRYWAKFQGAPGAVFASVSIAFEGDYDLFDDVTGRSRYAEWEKPADEDALFVSWHTNGSNDHTQRGTESYIYDGTWGGIWTPGSDLLQYFIHNTLVDDIRADWDPEWQDQGMLADNFGEVRTLESMPGVLLEIAFHDDAGDTYALLDPRFAQITARAVYRGIVRYFAHRDGVDPIFLPEPPPGLSVRNSGAGSLTVAWQPSPTDGNGPLGDEASNYHIYTSSDGFGWGNGVNVGGITHTLTGLDAGQLLFVRVTGVNEGGESLPSMTLGARVGDGGPARVLLVNGYARNDGGNNVWQNDGVTIDDTDEVGPSQRIFAWRHNRGDYVIQHGQAISLPFDSAARHVVTGAQVEAPFIDLMAYDMVDWMAGEESSQLEAIPANGPGSALSDVEQEQLTAFLSRGGALFINGSEIGLDLFQRGLGVDFYSQMLRAFYQGSDAFQRNVQPYPNLVIPTTGGLFDGLETLHFDNGDGDTYYADRVDFFVPAVDDPRPQSGLLYQAGIGHAALAWDSGHCARLVYIAFPFETIVTDAARQGVMDRVMGFLDRCGPQRVGFAQEIYHAAPASDQTLILVTLDSPATTSVHVSYATGDGTASAGKDYTPVEGVLTFAPGETVQQFGVPILMNAERDESRSVRLTLADSDGAMLGVDAAATLFIISDNTNVYLPIVGR